MPLALNVCTLGVPQADSPLISAIGCHVLSPRRSVVALRVPDAPILGIFAVLAEFERELIRERTQAGMEAAKARGVHVGRPSKLTPAQIRQARLWIVRRSKTLGEIADHYNVHFTTLRRAIIAARE